MEDDMLSVDMFIHQLWFQMLVLQAYNKYRITTHTKVPDSFTPPPTMHCNASDQWQQLDPVGNKGYEV